MTRGDEENKNFRSKITDESGKNPYPFAQDGKLLKLFWSKFPI